LLLNIVLNAIQAQPEGGEVVVSATGERGRKTVRLAVLDRGPGIPREARARVFEPFYTTREKGSGLGLFVVRRIVEAHQGRVRIEDADGGGSVVTVDLPATLGES
jgi:signal transduction histidine kinase